MHETAAVMQHADFVSAACLVVYWNTKPTSHSTSYGSHSRPGNEDELIDKLKVQNHDMHSPCIHMHTHLTCIHCTKYIMEERDVKGVDGSMRFTLLLSSVIHMKYPNISIQLLLLDTNWFATYTVCLHVYMNI